MEKHEFEMIITSYGAKADDWPSDKRGLMQNFITENPHIAQAMLSREAALDEHLQDAQPLMTKAFQARLETQMREHFSAAPDNHHPDHQQGGFLRYTLSGAVAAGLMISFFSAPWLAELVFSPVFQPIEIAALALGNL